MNDTHRSRIEKTVEESPNDALVLSDRQNMHSLEYEQISTQISLKHFFVKFALTELETSSNHKSDI